jgi:hypothetical protein
MPFVPYTQAPRTAARQLEEFDNSFRGALAIAEPDELWAVKLGLVISTDALKTTFPIPLDCVGYKEFKGEIKYRNLYHRAISVFNDKTWQDGVEILAKKLTMPDFYGWGEQPTKMAVEWTRLPNTLVAALLEANPNLELYRDPDTGTLTNRAWFAGDHPCNILLSGMGTFNNNRSTTRAAILNGQFFKDVKQYARSIKGPNGQPMGFRATGGTILCNGNNEDLLDEALKLDTVIREIQADGVVAPPGAIASDTVAAVTQQNRHKNTMSYLVADELTTASDDAIYVKLSGNAEAHGFVVMQEAQPEIIICDESDAKYKERLLVSYSAHGEAKAAAMMPHSWVKYTITG